MNKDSKIVITGGAGLVGQNLITDLVQQGFSNIHVLDKHVRNVELLREIHPNISSLTVDLAESGEWKTMFNGAEIVIQLQAQIGASSIEPFIRNNINSTNK